MLREAIATQLAGNGLNNGNGCAKGEFANSAGQTSIMEQLWQVEGNNVCADCCAPGKILLFYVIHS